MNTWIVTFFTISDAIAAERTAKKLGLQARLIPVPRQLSTGCGICLKVQTDTPQTLLDELSQEEVDVDACLDWEDIQ
ncbi:MAG TPA: DUF3343 domain-containing protein [Tissierellia bacterium]|jgi:hypothetical protein|nr:DUF3343 domain-containing protein [Tissierellia bacterium]